MTSSCRACAAKRGREYENDRDHLLAELAACRREIERLRTEVAAGRGEVQRLGAEARQARW